jgi:hypothetical protein
VAAALLPALPVELVLPSLEPEGAPAPPPLQFETFAEFCERPPPRCIQVAAFSLVLLQCTETARQMCVCHGLAREAGLVHACPGSGLEIDPSAWRYRVLSCCSRRRS